MLVNYTPWLQWDELQLIEDDLHRPICEAGVSIILKYKSS